jgi:hypothetical protein
VSHLEAYKKQARFLTPAVNLFLEQQRQEEGHQLPLATEFPAKNRAFAVFFRAPNVIPDAQLGTDAIEVANTHVDAELVLQCRLHLTTWHLGSRPAGRKQPLEYNFSQFRWMSVPPILEGDFTSPANFVQQTVGR